MLAMPGIKHIPITRALGSWVMVAYIDPFGAPEFLVDDVAFRMMVGNDFLRFGYYTQEQDEKILRVKIVFPVRRLVPSQAETRLFVTTQQWCQHQKISTEMN